MTIQRPNLDSLRQQVEHGVTNASSSANHQSRNPPISPPQTAENASSTGGLLSFAAIAVVVILIIAGVNSGNRNSSGSAVGNQPRVDLQTTNEAQRQAAAAAEAKRLADAKIQEANVEANRRAVAEAQRRAQEEKLRNPSVTFRIKNKYPGAVTLSFFSATDRNRVWPGGTLQSSNSYTGRLSCSAGEKICYGAWVVGDALSPYWGAGRKGANSCPNCCLTCQASEEADFELETRDATYPIPTLTWRVRSNHPNTVALSFYSRSRSREWPGGNQSYVLNDSVEHSYSINCEAREMICYGAWVHGNPRSGGWGVGFQRSKGCADCCYACNGGETRVISLNP